MTRRIRLSPIGLGAVLVVTLFAMVLAAGASATTAGNAVCSGGTASSPTMLTATTISGNLSITGICLLTQVTVDGNVVVQAGAGLVAIGSSFGGNLLAQNAAFIDVGENFTGPVGTTIGGNVAVQGTTGSTPTSAVIQALGWHAGVNGLCDLTVTGSLQVENNGSGAPFSIGSSSDCSFANTVSVNLQVDANAAAVTIGGMPNPTIPSVSNDATGNIQVESNSGGGTLTGNTAGRNCQLQSNTPGIVGSGNAASGTNSCNGTA
jgi:hypothetical protein